MELTDQNPMISKRTPAVEPGDFDFNQGSIYQAIKAAIRSGDLERAHRLLRHMINIDGSRAELWLLLAWTAPTYRSAQNIHKILARQHPGHPAVSQNVPWSGKEWGESTKTITATQQASASAPVGSASSVLQPPVLQHLMDSAPVLSLWERFKAGFTTTSFFTFLALYMAGIVLAEVTTTYVNAYLGLIIHGVLLVLILLHTSLGANTGEKKFLMTMALAPLIRLMSLSMPLLRFEFEYWYMLIGLPLLIAAMVVYRSNRYQPNQIGLTLGKNLPLQLVVAVTGIGLGFLEYMILRPTPLAKSFTLQSIWLPALILLVFTGFLEEFIFRGLMQYASLRTIKRSGFWYISLLFTVLHIGYQSLTDLIFVFLVGFFFSIVVARTQSLLGVTFAHGLTNISLFLIFPFLLMSPLQPGDTAALQPVRVQGPVMWASPPTQTPRPTEIISASPVLAESIGQVVTQTVRPSSTETATPTFIWETMYPVAPTFTLISTPTATQTTLPLVSETPMPSLTMTPLPSATESAVPAVTETIPPTATATGVATITQPPMLTATQTPVPTVTRTPVPTMTQTLQPTATQTPLPTVTVAPTQTATQTPLPTVTVAPTQTPLPTATEEPPATATPTALPTVTQTEMPTVEAAATEAIEPTAPDGID